MIGWIKLHRQLLEWEWWSDLPTRTLFIYILLKANHEDKKWQGIIIPTGSFVTSINNMAKDSCLSKQQIRTSLAKLIKTQEVTCKTTNKYTVVTVSEWDKHQQQENQITRNPTNEQQTNNKQITTTKEVKKIRSKEVITIPDFIDKKLFDSFIEMRSKIKKPLTLQAKKLIINKLVSFSEKGIDANKSLENSIMNCWQGVFEPKQESIDNYGNTRNSNTRKSKTEEIIDAIASFK